MADKIQSITFIDSPFGSRISGVRGYTNEERKNRIKEMEKSILEHKEMLDIRKEVETLYPNPDHLSFKECLAEEMNPSAKTDDDDQGFILDIKNY